VYGYVEQVNVGWRGVEKHTVLYCSVPIIDALASHYYCQLLRMLLVVLYET
jgi:hypothetical protein